ncbi:hypothetical protein PIB30_085577 [Stylosanthes scabra]|uniref:Uncharacterized protein n=1 Tax=Stylosanthes scabra TaxID=79078 RepID=A0ABU6XSA0_9FABA|nr:hypothetical protein [Stylosanthes scabra]
MAKKKVENKAKDGGKSLGNTSSSKNIRTFEGHLFRCLPRTFAQMFLYLQEQPEERALVDQMGFGAFSHLPNQNLDQVLLKQIFDCYDIYDNTIYTDAAAVKITTKKIGDALGLSSNGTIAFLSSFVSVFLSIPFLILLLWLTNVFSLRKGAAYDTRVVRKNLSDEDKDVHKFFQGKTTVALQNLIKTTPLDTDENRKLFMRSFICFIKNVFLLPNSTANISPTAFTTIFDLENIRNRNWTLHVHNFLLQELKKAKQNNSAAIHGCVYVLMSIYFHETQFGEDSREIEAQPPWIGYWTGEALEKRMKQEKKLDTGLLKTGEMRARKKKTTMRFPSSDADSLSGFESYRSRSSYSASEFGSTSDSEHTVSEEPPPQKELSSKRKSDRTVVGSNAPLSTTQHSVAVAGVLQPVVEQPEKTHDDGVEIQPEGTHESGLEVQGAEVQAPSIGEDVVHAEIHPTCLAEPQPVLLDMQQSETHLVSEVEAPPPKVGDVVQEGLQPDQQHGENTEDPNDRIALDPEPIDMQGPSETQDPKPCSLTLRPWLQPEATDEIITNVLLSMNKEGPSTRDED